MTLYIKKQIFAHLISFDVYDHKDDVLYTTKQDGEGDEKRLHIYDAQGKEVVLMQENFTDKRPTFDVMIHGKFFAQFHKEVSWKKKAFTAECDMGRYEVNQNFISTKVTISFQDSPVATIEKNTTGWRETHLLHIDRNDNLLFYIATVLLVDFFHRRDTEGEESLS